MNQQSAEERRNAIVAFHGKNWTHPPRLEWPLNSDLRVPKRYFGDPNRQYHLFENWRPLARTVRSLLDVELCPLEFQEEQRKQFVLCWSAHSEVSSMDYPEVLEVGESYTYVPHASQEQWNDRYEQWVRSAWIKALDEVECSRSILEAYAGMFEKALDDPKWLRRIADHHVNRTWPK